MARRLNIFCVRQLMGFLVPEALFVSMGWGGKKRRMGGTWEEEEVNTTLLTNHLSCHHHPHVLTLSACLESIAVSIFVHMLVELTNTVSEAKIQICASSDSETRCLVLACPAFFLVKMEKSLRTFSSQPSFPPLRVAVQWCLGT